ncbi:MAG: hypothetical protein L6Q38_12170 [Nitrospira sp.]|nr:hypothetical protein [Nitrospira sp.]
MSERDDLGMLDWAEAEAKGPEPCVAPATFAGAPIPRVIAQAGSDAARRFIEFFTAHSRNPNTSAAYARAVSQFLQWCDARAVRLRDLNPILVATYVEQLPARAARPTRRRSGPNPCHRPR